MKFRGKDKKSSLFLGCFGILVALTSYGLGLGTPNQPGTGLLPFSGGLIMILLSVIVYFQAIRFGAEEEKELIQIGKRRTFLFIIILFLFALLFKKVGFFVTNFFFLIVLFQLLERRSWRASIFFSATTTLVTYLIFVVWLKVQLPKGFIGF